jgi:hypothetical protein
MRGAFIFFSLEKGEKSRGAAFITLTTLGKHGTFVFFTLAPSSPPAPLGRDGEEVEGEGIKSRDVRHLSS